METENQLIRYNFNNGKSDIEVNLANEMIWLSLNGMVELFDRDKSVISRHIGNIYKERELDKSSTVAKIAAVQKKALAFSNWANDLTYGIFHPYCEMITNLFHNKIMKYFLYDKIFF